MGIDSWDSLRFTESDTLGEGNGICDSGDSETFYVTQSWKVKLTFYQKGNWCMYVYILNLFY